MNIRLCRVNPTYKSAVDTRRCAYVVSYTQRYRKDSTNIPKVMHVQKYRHLFNNGYMHTNIHASASIFFKYPGYSCVQNSLMIKMTKKNLYLGVRSIRFK